jgi:hypothetical protein
MLVCLNDYYNPDLGLTCAAGDRLIAPTPELEAWLLHVSEGAFVTCRPPVGQAGHAHGSRAGHAARRRRGGSGQI